MTAAVDEHTMTKTENGAAQHDPSAEMFYELVKQGITEVDIS